MGVQSQTAVAIPSDLGAALDPRPLIDTGRRWTRYASPVFSVLLLVAVAYQFRNLDLANLRALMPTGIAFWVAFLAYYLLSPATEWIIFRRLWQIPASGFAALVRKLVSNEILLGYLGEVQFYAWARRNAHIVAAPFGAIKDVTILSGLVGNAATLAMVIVAAPLIGGMHIGLKPESVIGSAIVVLGVSLVILLLRKRLFTLPRRELLVIAGLHLARVIATTFLAAVMWHLLLPAVALSWWVLLGTLRMLISRLPLVPNKDVVFAALASFLVAQEVQIAAAMALMATLILATHLLVAALLGASDLAHGSAAA